MNEDSIKIGQQICHPLYSASNALLRAYRPLLAKLDLTYPQYLVMMVLWEQDAINIKKISEETFFDSGTITPLLEKLVKKGLIKIEVSKADRRNKFIHLTARGKVLKERALEVPREMVCLMKLSEAELKALKKLTTSLLKSLT